MWAQIARYHTRRYLWCMCIQRGIWAVCLFCSPLTAVVWRARAGQCILFCSCLHVSFCCSLFSCVRVMNVSVSVCQALIQRFVLLQSKYPAGFSLVSRRFYIKPISFCLNNREKVNKTTTTTTKVSDQDVFLGDAG